MAIKKVLIIFDEDRFTKEMILGDMKSEGFRYEFKVFNEIEPENYPMYVDGTDEVWTFGEVGIYVITKLCEGAGKDFWVMK